MRRTTVSTQSARALLKQIKGDRRLLRRAYKRALDGEGGVREWLRDNYYLLDREAAAAAKNLRRTGPYPAEETPMAAPIAPRRAAGAPDHGYPAQETAALPSVSFASLRPDKLRLRAYRLCEVAARSAEPITDSLPAVLQAFRDKRAYGLTVAEADALPAFLQAAFLHMAAEAVESIYDAKASKKDAAFRMSAAVNGLRALPAMDFTQLTETFCSVEAIFKSDPAGVYEKMEEGSRSRYRSLCARIARKRHMDEVQLAIGLRRKAADYGKNGGADPRMHHIGWWLREADRSGRDGRRRLGVFLLLCRYALPVLISASLALWLGTWWIAPLALLPMIEILRPLMDWVSGLWSQPAFLPRLELETGIPDEGACLIVVSQLVPPADRAEELAGRLLHLARTNAPAGEDNCKICLLADLRQADKPHLPGDNQAIDALRRVIRRLNRQEGNRFILAVRGRVMVRTQNAYAGWERKRGAITQLIRLCRGETGCFCAMEGDISFLRRTRYLLALDADTETPLDTARRMVAAALHPLNRPVIDRQKGVVTDGYGILSPRVGTTLQSAAKTPFSRIMSGAGGITAYDTLSGDLYQDYFERSIFAGKGLIDAEAFYTLMDGFVPDERVLSHDILEGSVLRCGYLSDVEVTDGCPGSAMSYLSRLHRWIRGDWQNLPWIRKKIPVGPAPGHDRPTDGGHRMESGRVFVPARVDVELAREQALTFDMRLTKPRRQQKRLVKNPLSGLCRYMLLDNLRRSITPTLAALCLILGCLTPAASGWLAAVALLSQAAPGIFTAFMLFLTGGLPAVGRRYYAKAMPAALTALSQAVMNCLLLFQTACLSLQAAFLGLWRQYVSRKNLLEWVTAADSEQAGTGWGVFFRFWPSLAAGVLLFFMPDSITRLAALCFVLAPPVVLLTARPTGKRPVRLTDDQRDKLAGQAAAMWRFYEELCTNGENWLPPDNMQEAPVYALAHRASPTNIGLCFLSTLAARDLGYIETAQMVKRLTGGIASVEKMEKWEGNLLNWYDTKTLEPLRPRYVSTVDSGNFICCLTALQEGLREYEREDPSISALRGRIIRLVDQTRLGPLYDERRKLFRIGYDLEKEQMSNSYYDLLMSESRTTSYFAVATRQVDRRHWGALGRTLAKEDGYAGPVSWSGTMFEYFMPHLLLPVPDGSLSYEALRFCIRCQKKRARELGKPWGCSESGFYAFDPQLNYQYKAHGIQRLGLRRQLNNEYVVAPYATFLTLPTIPQTSIRNLDRLEKMGLCGRYGFYEAADFTRDRAGAAGFSPVRSYMAHHVGMSLLSVYNLLENGKMQKRFMAAGTMSAARELLEEKLPPAAPVFNDLIHRDVPEKPGRTTSEIEEFDIISPRQPRVHLLSNGEWTVTAADCGVSISSCQGVDVLRRSEDLLRRPLGLFAVVEPTGREERPVSRKEDRRPGRASKTCPFSITAAPLYIGDARRRTVFGGSFAAYYAETENLEAGMRIQVHETQPCEIRRFALRSKNGRKQTVQLLLYAEPSLARPEDAEAHPAFSRLFLHGEYKPDQNLLLFTRRPREGEGGELSLAIGFAEETAFAFDFDREKILQRPAGVSALLRKNIPLNGSPGVPDLCAALRLTMELPAKGQRMATLLMTVGRSPEEAANRLLDCRKSLRAAPAPLFDGSLEGRLCQAVLPELLFPGRDSKARLTAARTNRRGVDGLWSLGISGDLPILLLEIKNPADAIRAEPYIRLHRRLRRYGTAFDLALAYPQEGDYDRPAEEALRQLIRAEGCEGMIGEKAGIHLVNRSRHAESYETLLAAARFIVPDSPTQIHPPAPVYEPAAIYPVRRPVGNPLPADAAKQPVTVAGGYFADDRFVITQRPALPWCHVLANERFGTLVSDSALGFTWALNCRENKLTPWYNDTATDNRGEMLLLRVGGRIYDLILGSLPIFRPGGAQYLGLAGGIESEVRVEIVGDAKRITVELTGGDAVEPIELAYYTEPVLGVSRAGARQISAKWERGGLYLHNPFQTSVPGGMYLTAGKQTADQPTLQKGADGCVCDRGAFLSGRWGEHTLCPLPDPCGAVVVKRELPAWRKEKIQFVLSYGENREQAVEAAHRALDTDTLPQPVGAEDWGLTVQTGDKGLDVLVNTWLPAQIQQCRIFGRTGFYQCGGAYGFRDQLQDVCAQVYWNPAAARKHILRAAAHQFEEGDVLHWWHPLPADPPHSRDAGVRTRVSDDMLWLPYAVCHYLDATGDRNILEEQIPFLSAPPLSEREPERYFAPSKGASGSLLDHCLRAFDTIRLGQHGLPLMGAGDWNDGLSRVGEQGKGESVWLAQFAALTARRMATVCRHRGAEEKAERLDTLASQLVAAVDREAWSGEWYLRAFLDDGGALGGPYNREMRIDLLPQAFAVLSDMPDEQRKNTALDAALRLLVDKGAGIIKLFAPPFEKEDPGYIRGYPPGVRENGGQYTHGAIWLIRALFRAGRAEEAYGLLRMISPVTRNEQPGTAALYKAEPYAMAADVYAAREAAGRAGWTLYTGSAGWYYRTVVEDLLGLRVQGDRLALRPALPDALPAFTALLRRGGSTIHLTAEKKSGGAFSLLVDGLPADAVPLDGRDHTVRLTLP